MAFCILYSLGIILSLYIKTIPTPTHPLSSPATTNVDRTTTPHRTPSFKEDTYHHHNLKPSEKKALQELKDKLISSGDASVWGIPLLSATGGTEKSDVVLLKFLRVRDFRVQDSFTMLLKCLQRRKEFAADAIVEEDLGFKDLEGVVAYMNRYDREGHPVCYNAYGVFKDKDLYEKTFGDNEKLKKFLR
ncbi:hypothetical protein R6Q57_026164 [Mikania cordata]